MNESTEFDIADSQALALGGGICAVGLLVLYGAVTSVPEEIVLGGDWSLRLSGSLFALALGILIIGYYCLRQMTIDTESRQLIITWLFGEYTIAFDEIAVVDFKAI